MSSSRQLAAIMFTDIVGYTALMGEDEEKAFELLRKNRHIQKPLIEKFNGKWLKEIGDGVLASFTTVSDAVYCAKEIQEACQKDHNLNLRIGIHQGEVVFEGDDVFGDGVNIASRIEALAPTCGIWVSEAVERNLQNKKGIETSFVREEQLKNVKSPVKIYEVSIEVVEVPEAIKEKAVRSQSSAPDEKKASKQRQMAFVSLAFIIALVLLYFLFPKNGSNNSTASAKELSIAVLPFSNTKPDPDTDFLGFAIANQIIGDLDYIQNVTVRPSSSIRKYDKQVFDAIIVADDLRVNHVLTGSYLMQADIIRLDIELIEVISNNMIWRDDIEVEYHNAFELQDIVAKKVVDGLNVKLTPKELNRISKDISSNPIAYDYYLKAISYPLSIEGHRLAIEMLNKSIELDSNYAPAYSHLGFRTRFLAFFNLENLADRMAAENYYLKALSLNSDLLTAQADLAMLYAETGRTDKAIKLAREMVEINPNNAVAHFSLSYIYRFGGMLEEAVEEVEKAIALDPKNPRFRQLGVTYINVGNYKKALETFELDKGSAYSLGYQSQVFIKQGKNDQAVEYCDRIIDTTQDKLWILVAKTQRAYLQDSIELGRKTMIELENANISDSEAWYFWASLYGLLGDHVGTARGLRKAIDGGYFNYPFMVIDPFMDSVRDDPEIQKLFAQAKAKHDAFKEKFF